MFHYRTSTEQTSTRTSASESIGDPPPPKFQCRGLRFRLEKFSEEKRKKKEQTKEIQTEEQPLTALGVSPETMRVYGINTWRLTKTNKHWSGLVILQ